MQVHENDSLKEDEKSTLLENIKIMQAYERAER